MVYDGDTAGWGGVGRDPVSHFACPGKVRGNVEGMAESEIA